MTRKILIGILALSVFLAILPASVQAPLPHGVSGTVYLLDGVTQAPRGTHFSVNDTSSGFCIEGTTGGPSMPEFDGFYSASVTGEDGDDGIIRAWNATHYGELKVTLRGDMGGIDVLINTPLSLPSPSPSVYPKGGGGGAVPPKVTFPTTPTATQTPLTTPTPFSVPMPEATPELTPTPFLNTTQMHTPSATPKPESKIPGFEAFFAILGVLALAYMLRSFKVGK
jgi:hypothetical protein